MFADDGAVSSRTEQELQELVNGYSKACKDFGQTISLKKTNVLAQGVETPRVTTIDNYELGVVHQFTYLGSAISDNLSFDADEITQRIGKAATTLDRHTTHVWESPKLTITTKMAVYNACIISTLLYGSEAWTTQCRSRH